MSNIKDKIKDKNYQSSSTGINDIQNRKPKIMLGNKHCTSIIFDVENGIINMVSAELDTLEDYKLRTSNISHAIGIGIIKYNLPSISVVFYEGDPDRCAMLEINVCVTKIHVNCNSDDFYRIDMKINVPTKDKEPHDYFNTIQNSQYKELYYYKASQTKMTHYDVVYDVVYVMFIIDKKNIIVDDCNVINVIEKVISNVIETIKQ